MTSAVPASRILFVPVSGPVGSGELQRSLILASAVRQRWPQVDIRFAVSQLAPMAARLPFPAERLAASPTRCTPDVVRLLADMKPHLVIFDGAARVAQLKAARALGAKTIFVSARPSGRRKGFRLRLLRHLHETWWTQPAFLEPELSDWERLKLHLTDAPAPQRIGPLFERPAGDSVPLLASRYAVLCLGLSQDKQTLRAISVFKAVANELQAATGLHAVMIGMPRTGCPDPPGVTSLPTQQNSRLMAWLQSATLAFTNGGSLLLQALALGTATIAIPVHQDQSQRITACVRAGMAATATAEPDALLDCARMLMRDPTRREAMRVAARDAFQGSGLELALQRIGFWLKLPIVDA